ncbi:MAG: Ig-like domain-containing protein [Patescibacteria group bacterium]
MKIIKNLIKISTIFLFSLILFSIYHEDILASCYTNSQCSTVCSNCPGFCIGATTREVCDQIKCATCYQCPDYNFDGNNIPEINYCLEGSLDCYCDVDCYDVFNSDGICYYDVSCTNIYCPQTVTCLQWSGWSACVNSWQYRTCISGEFLSDWKYCGVTNPSNPTPTPPNDTISCSIQLTPATISMLEGGYTSFVANVSDILGGQIEEVRFSSENNSIVSVNPTTDLEASYLTSALGLSQGSTNITANAIISSLSRCSDSALITVTPPGAWWQIKNSDISTSGSLTSYIPNGCTLPTCSPYFSLDGEGGYPGIPFYSNSYFFGTDKNISTTNWIAQTSMSIRQNYNYSFFERQIPASTVINEIVNNSVQGEYFLNNGIENDGYYWFKYQGDNDDFYINSDLNLGDRKVILLLNGKNLHIEGKINLNDGLGFFIALAGKNNDGNNGNVYFSSNITGAVDGLPELEGLFFAENSIYTGSTNSQLHIRGSLVGLSGIYLQRDLEDNNSLYSSELIEYAPDLILLFPSELKNSKIKWSEIAP